MACGSDNLGKIDFRGRYRHFSHESVSWQQLAVVELPLLALLFLVFSISALVSPDFELRASGVSVPLLYTCPFFALTGIPCLFCGMTRSFLAMGGLDVGQSLSYHPLGPALFILFAGLAVALAVSVVSRRRIRVSIGSALRRRLVTGGAALLLAAWLVKVVIWRQTGLI
ncbi:MAG: DUF2752 domain-containing protein [Thermoleophilia bacterium]